MLTRQETLYVIETSTCVGVLAKVNAHYETAMNCTL